MSHSCLLSGKTLSGQFQIYFKVGTGPDISERNQMTASDLLLPYTITFDSNDLSAKKCLKYSIIFFTFPVTQKLTVR